MIISLTILLFSAPELVINTMINESKNVVSLCINLIAIYAVWMGILEIVEKTGLGEKLANLLSPIIKKLFKINNSEQIKYVAMNLSANFLGLGNAATPSGIKAIKSMENDLKHTRFAMLMLLVVNSTGLQLLPTTAISLRINAGSTTASDIILPTLLATLASTLFGIIVMFLLNKVKRRWVHTSFL